LLLYQFLAGSHFRRRPLALVELLVGLVASTLRILTISGVVIIVGLTVSPLRLTTSLQDVLLRDFIF
jgi:low affinity Fe/Cu permease